jgi:DNA repair exonuclease SbcCD nuclease subunit
MGERDMATKRNLKFAVFSDLQAHQWTDCSSLVTDLGVQKRLLDHVSVIDQITEICKTNSIKLIIFLGDLYQLRGIIDTAVESYILKSFRAMGNDVDNIVMVAGNHDYYTKFRLSCLSPFDGVAKIYDQGEDKIQINGFRFRILPYTSSSSEIEEFLQNTSDGDINLLHAGVDNNNTPYRVDESRGTIDGSHLPDHALLNLLGDYHNFLQLNENSFYIGSPLPLNWGDVGKERGFVIISLDVDQTPGRVIVDLENIPLRYPEFIEIKIKNLKEIHEFLVDIPDNFVRVTVPDSMSISDLKALKILIENNNPRSLKIIREIDSKNLDIAITDLVQYWNKEKLENAIISEMKDMSVPDHIDRGRLVKLFNQIAKES